MITPDWLLHALESPQVTDILINGIHSVFIDQGRGLELLEGFNAGAAGTGKPLWTQDALRLWILNLLSTAGKTWDAKHPFIDATIPSGHRLHVAFPPITPQGILISLRRLSRSSMQKSENHSRWTNSDFFLILVEAVKKGESILVSGSTGSGKTTLVSDLLEFVPQTERIIALEDIPELSPEHPHFLSLNSRPPNADGFGEVTLRSLLRQALRMRPDRIVLGECRGSEVLDLLQTLNTGHSGALATLHANSPRDALRRVELLCVLASGGYLAHSAIRELLSVGIQWIAQVKRIGHIREITELSRVEGREGDTILLRPMIQRRS